MLKRLHGVFSNGRGLIDGEEYRYGSVGSQSVSSALAIEQYDKD